MILLTILPVSASQKWELALSGATWTAWPITPLVEHECRNMIEHVLDQLLGWTVPVLLIQNNREDIRFDSHGLTFGLALTRHFAATPWSVGLEATWLHLDLPYTLDYNQQLNVRGLTLIRADTQASGLARIRSIDGALGLHYRLLRHGRFSLVSSAGIHLMILDGDITLSGQSDINSILGDEILTFDEATTMEELRELGLNLPRLLIYPSVSLRAGWRFWSSLSLTTRLTLSQGLFLSLGLAAEF